MFPEEPAAWEDVLALQGYIVFSWRCFRTTCLSHFQV